MTPTDPPASSLRLCLNCSLPATRGFGDDKPLWCGRHGPFYASDKPPAGPSAVPALPSGARQQTHFEKRWGGLIGKSGAAAAASRDASAEERAERLMPGPDGLRASPGEIAAAIRAAEAARDARWREALRKYVAHYGDLVAECADCEGLRALLGSGATDPKGPSDSIPQEDQPK